MNKVILMGRLGKDPVIRYSQSGNAVANFSLATDESFYGSDGAKTERVEWHRIVVFDRTAETCYRYLKKGRRCMLEGRIHTRKYVEKDTNIEKSITEIIVSRVEFCDSNQGQNTDTSNNYGEYQSQGSAETYGGTGYQTPNAASYQQTPQEPAQQSGQYSQQQEYASSPTVDDVPF